MRAFTILLGAALAAAPSPLAAQAFTAPEGVGAVTVSWQFVDNTGHRGTDGFYIARGQSVTTSALFEIDYAINDRLTVGLGTPFVFAKYTGGLPPFSRLPRDACKCWHSSFQDLALMARYRLGTARWAVTPLVRYSLPTHDYPYRGEAVVGRNLHELQLGVSAGLRLEPLIPKLTLQGGYTYALVERALEDIDVDRSNGVLDVGYVLTRRLYVRGTGTVNWTHGGLRAGSVSGRPFPLPGELNTPERRAEGDRLIKSLFWQAGGGLAYTLGSFDVFASYMKYVWGRDAHNGHSYNAGVTWYFEMGKKDPWALHRRPGHAAPSQSGRRFERRLPRLAL